MTATLLVPTFLALGAYLLGAGLARRPAAKRSPWREAMRGTPEPAEPQVRGGLRTRGLLDRLRAPSSIVHYGERLLGEAGLGHRLTPQRLIAISLIAGTVLPGWLVVTTGEALGARAFALAPVAACVGLAAPWILVAGRAERRRDAIEGTLPDVLDLITVSVEAGLALEAALQRVGQQGDDALRQELRRTLSEIGLGRRRREALTALANRTGVTAVRTLVNAMNQAERSGMQIGPVLRAQAEQLRQRRRQRAEEAALKAPLKMLFPLVAFIFPAMFVVLIGPATMELMKLFGS